MKLGDLVPGGKWTMGKTDRIKVFKDTAAVDYQAVYVDQAYADKWNSRYGTSVTPGWYKDTDTSYETNINNEPLPYGTSVMAITGQTGAWITSNGEVVEGEDGKIRFELTKSKFKMIGNCTPVALTLGNFVPGGKWTMGKTDRIKVFKDTAAVDYQAVYVDQAYADKWNSRYGTSITPGWYKDTDTSYETNISNEPIPAGVGFMAITGQAGAYIEIPSAL